MPATNATSPVVTVELRDGPLPISAVMTCPGAGATLVFEGVVRPHEAGRLITSLDYEAYEPMTSRQLRVLADAIVAEYGVNAVHVAHSVGRVPVGAVSFRLTVFSTHRKEGIAALDAFIDRMKRDVALWKTPVFAGDRDDSGHADAR